MRFNLTVLEERIVLDAAGALDILNSYHLESVNPSHTDAQPTDDHSAALADSTKEPLLTDGLVPSSQSGTNILVISSAVDHSDVLAAAAKDPSHVIIYDANHTSLEELTSKISTMLNGDQADSIAFINNGNSGAFALTSDVTVSLDSLQASPELQAFWDAIGLMVKDNGQINLLACNVASTSAGIDLVNQIQNIANEGSHNVQVDASSDLTANSALGGDWNLELGNVQVDSLYFTNSLANWDGHLEGPAHLVMDIIPGNTGSNPGNYLDAGNGFFVFSARSTITAGSHDTIWISNGLASGTSQLINVHPELSVPLELDNFTLGANSGSFFFTVHYQNNGEHHELWIANTNGSSSMISDFESQEISSLTMLGNRLIFVAGDGSELWSRDPSTGTTSLLFDINSTGSARMSGFTVASDRLYFFADNGATGKELWVTDGSDAINGTIRLTDSNPLGDSVTSRSEIITGVGRTVYVVLEDSLTDGRLQNQIWKSDGTPQGTTLIKDMDSKYTVDSLTLFNSKLYFLAAENQSAGIRELWSMNTDGSNAGIVYNITNANAAGFELPVERSLYAVNNALIMFIGDPIHNDVVNVFRYTGSGTPTQIGSGGVATSDLNVHIVGNDLYYQARYALTVSEKSIFKIDGGTNTVSRVTPSSGLDAGIEREFNTFNNAIVFTHLNDVINPINAEPWTNFNYVPQGTTDSGTSYKNHFVSGNVLTNDALDLEGSVRTVQISTGPQHGAVTLLSNGLYTYTPSTFYIGSDTFYYRIYDGSEYSDPITVNISVIDPQLQQTQTFSTHSNTPLAISNASLLVGSNSLAENPLSITITQMPTKGTLILNGSGTGYIYTPSATIGNTTDIFKYVGNSVSNEAVVTITIGNTAPVAVNDSYSVNSNAFLNVSNTGGVAVNDFDAEGDYLFGSIVDQTNIHGTLSFNTFTYGFTYIPTADYVGLASFTYKLFDGVAFSNEATVNITVLPTSTAVAISDGVYQTYYTSVLNNPALNLFSNDIKSVGSTTQLVTGPSHGSVILLSDGTFSYTPSAGYQGTDSFTYRINDNGIFSAAAQVNLNVIKPVAGNLFVSVDKNTAINVSNLMVSTGDPNATVIATQPLIGIATTGPTAHGVITTTANGFVYTPNVGYVGSDSFTYKVQTSDGLAESIVKTAVVTVLDANNVVVVPKTFTVTEDINFQTNSFLTGISVPFSFPDGGLIDPATGLVTSNPIVIAGVGTARLHSFAGTFVFTPAANYSGGDVVLTYRIFPFGDPATYKDSTITVHFTPVNDAPVAVNDSGFQADEDTILFIPISALLANDTDIDSTKSSLSIDPLSLTSGAVIQGAYVRFTPAPNSFGTGNFTYKVRDGLLTSSNSATVSFTISPTEDAPITNNVSLSGNEDTARIIFTNISSSDPDGGVGSFRPHIVTYPQHGTLTVTGTNDQIIYTPHLNFVGTDTFTYYVTSISGDTTLHSNIATATMTVNAVNDAPQANADGPYVMSVGVESQITGNVLANDYDVENGAFTAVLVTGPSAANTQFFSLDPDGTFTFIPTFGFSGFESFTYRPSEGLLQGNPITVTLIVNDTPSSGFVDFVVNEDQTDPGLSTISLNLLSGIVDNYHPTGLRVTDFSVFFGSSVGTVSAPDPLGNIKVGLYYNESGAIQFTYRVTDGLVTSNNIIGTIIVNAVNDAPLAGHDSFTVKENGILNVSAPGVLANDSDIDSANLTAIVDVGPAHGTLTLNANGSFIYTPHTNYSGADQFTYHARDGSLNSDSATVSITVNANVAPIANDDSYTVAEDGILSVGGPGVLANDSDIDNANLTSILESGPAHGTLLSFNSDGSFNYQPNVNFNGIDSFSYRVSDGQLSSIATVTINVTAVNDGPVAASDSYTIAENGVLNVAAPGVLANDSDIDNANLTAVLTSSTTFGTLSFNPDGSFIYTPNTGFYGADSFSYYASDGDLVTDVTTVSIDVTLINHAPVVTDDSYTVAEDGVLNVNAPGILANDTDINNDGLSAILESGPAHGILELNADGSFSYTPDANFNGSDSFSYRASDGMLTSTSIATVTINVNAVNDAPVASNDSYTVAEDGVLNVAAPGVLANDADIDSSSLTAILESGPAHGILALNADGSFSYTPNANFNGSDSFSYRASDGVLTSIATVTINVTAVNDAPVATNDSYNVAENGILNVGAPGVLANDTDIDSAILTAVPASLPSHGTLAFNGDGSFSYIPDPDFSGSDSFIYYASDGSLLSSLAATVTINVTNVNSAPVASNDSYSLAEDGILTGNVLANDTDIDSANLTAVLDAGPAHGILSLNADGSFSYTPNANYYGADQFTYHANDGSLNSMTATVSITITPVNDAPIANDDAYAVDEDGGLNGNVLANDTDIDSATLTAVLDSGPAHGVLTLNADGSFSYTPNANYYGADQFTYHANDGSLNSVTATVSITINPVNDAPIANDDSYAVAEDGVLSVDAPGILTNDTDIDSATLTAIVDVGPAHGILSLNADGSFSYTPNANYYGADQFTYHANDGSLNSVTATVSITVTPVNDAPIANHDAYAVDEDGALNGNVLANDTDIDSATLTAVLDSGPAHGILSLNADGSFSYTPNANYFGADQFTYYVNDGSLDSGIATVSITVNPVNDAPIANGDSFTVAEDGALNGNVLANDTDIDSANLTAVLNTGPSHGLLTLNADGSFSYNPGADFYGVDQFTYHVNDGSLNSGIATVSINITPVNDAPIAVNNSYTIAEDNILNIAAPGVLANDSDIDSGSLTAILESGPAHGILSLNSDGSFSYTPDANFNGSDSFSYRASDGELTSVATVNITITAVNDAPVADVTTITTNEDTSITFSLGSDVDGNSLTVTIISAPTKGGLTPLGGALYRYTPFPNQNGSDSFSFSVSDGTLSTGTVTKGITITPVNDPPVAANRSFNTLEDTALTLSSNGLITASSDPDGIAGLTAILDTQPTKGIISNFNASTGTFVYTPNLNSNGLDTFTYHIFDGEFNSATATVSINVTPVNDVPVADQIAPITTSEDTAVIFTLTGTDVENGTNVIVVISSPASHGTLTALGGGQFRYTPAGDYNGTDSFNYRVRDSQNALSAPLTAQITITAVNDAPVANNDAFVVAEDGALNGNVLTNDTDVDSANLTAVLDAGPAHGVLTLNADGSFTYTPAANFYGSDQFTYHANDGSLNSSIATVSITVTPVNDAPIANNDAFVVAEDGALNGNALTNDTDVDSANLTFVLDSGPSHGIFAWNDDGSFNYFPGTDFYGADQFTYHVNDGSLDSGIATVSITVTAVNDAPIANGDAFVIVEDGALNGNVLANDTDVDNTNLTAVLNTGPAHGILTLNANGSFSYTPAANFYGSDQFTYHVNDGNLDSGIATVSITVTPVNDAPVANNDAFIVAEEGALNGNALTNDTDVESANLTFVLDTGPSHGIFAWNDDGSFNYFPGTDFYGSDQFTYHVNDGSLDSGIATVSITVTPVNDAPVANGDSFTVAEDGALNGNVLANDTDVDSATLTAVLNTGPAHGVLTLNANGSFSYIPAANYYGADQFTYHVNDGGLNSSIATVSINVTPVNDAPTVDPINVSTVNDTAVTIPPAGHDVENDALTYSVVNQPINGSVAFDLNGNFVYTPNAGFVGDDNFTYQANDGQLNSNIATIFITISNDHEISLSPDVYSVAKNNSLNISPDFGLLSNDSSNVALTITSYSAPANGTITVNPDGSFRYVPATNFLGSDSFTYTASNGFFSATATVTLNVVNSTIKVSADSYTTREDTALIVPRPGVMSNDGTLLTVVGFTQAQHGYVVLNADGSFTYQPGYTLDANGTPIATQTGFFGTDTFSYTASNASGTLTKSATVTIKVTALNDYVATAGTLVVYEGSTGNTGDASTLLSGAAGGSLPPIFTISKAPAHGTLTLSANGQYTYIPTPGYINKDVINDDTFVIKATGDSSDNALIKITVDIKPSLIGSQGIEITGVKGVNTGVITLGSFTDVNPGSFVGKFTATINWGDRTTSIGTIIANGQGGYDIQGNHTYATAKDFTITITVVDTEGSTVIIKDTAHITPTINLSNSAILVTAKDGAVVGSLTASSDSSFLMSSNSAFKLNGSKIVVADATKLVGGSSQVVDIIDNNSEAAPKSFVINIVDVAPIANGETYSYSNGSPATLSVNAMNGLLKNDANYSRNAMGLTAVLVHGPAHGTIALNADGSFSYVAANGYSGVDSFSYQVTDGILNSEVATVNINDNPEISAGTGAEYYVARAASVTLFEGFSFSDDSEDFINAVMTASFSDNGTSSDILSIKQSALVTTLNGKLYFNSQEVGTYSGGTNLKALKITFNADATAEAISAVGSSIAYSNNSANLSTATRTVQLTISDGEGGISNTLYDTIFVRKA